MKKIIILTLLAYAAVLSCAQEKQCNRSAFVKSYQERLPKDICLPEGYILVDILSDTTDMNGDSRVDFAARLQKINAQDGDTTLAVLYKQNESGNYEEWVTFNNLFPIYLKDYRYDYDRDFKERRDTSYFMKLRVRYVYPELTDVFFNKDTITVKFNIEGGGGLLLYFSFNKNKENWYLVKQSRWLGDRGMVEKIIHTTIPQNQYNIKEFNMLDYLDDIIWE
jgi:hypothetical protein